MLGISEWLFGALLLAGFWNKKLGVLGALGSVMTFLCTVTIIPFMPDGWAASAGGFPAMVGNVAFLMKDVVLLAVSFYLLKQDAARVTPARDHANIAGMFSRMLSGERQGTQLLRLACPVAVLTVPERSIYALATLRFMHAPIN